MDNTEQNEEQTSEQEVMEPEVEAQPEAQPEAPKPSKPKMNKKVMTVSVIVAIIIILGALEVSGTTHFVMPFVNQFRAVAYVNGEKITKSEFEARKEQILNSPQAQQLNLSDPTVLSNIESQILDEMINTDLLLQEAGKAGITASADDVQKQYDDIATRLGGEDKLLAELKNNNLSHDGFLKNIGDQLVIESLLSQNVSTSTITVSDEEIQTFYDQNVKGQDGAPALAEISSQIRDQISSQKQQLLVNDYIDGLRASSSIQIVK